MDMANNKSNVIRTYLTEQYERLISTNSTVIPRKSLVEEVDGMRDAVTSSPATVEEIPCLEEFLSPDLVESHNDLSIPTYPLDENGQLNFIQYLKDMKIDATTIPPKVLKKMRQNLQRRVHNLSVKDPSEKKKRSHGTGYQSRRAEARNQEILRRRNSPTNYVPHKKLSTIDHYEDDDNMVWLKCSDCSALLDYDNRRMCIECFASAGVLTMEKGGSPKIVDFEKANELVVCNGCSQNDNHKSHKNIPYEWFKAFQKRETMFIVATRIESNDDQSP